MLIDADCRRLASRFLPSTDAGAVLRGGPFHSSRKGKEARPRVWVSDAPRLLKRRSTRWAIPRSVPQHACQVQCKRAGRQRQAGTTGCKMPRLPPSSSHHAISTPPTIASHCAAITATRAARPWIIPPPAMSEHTGSALAMRPGLVFSSMRSKAPARVRPPPDPHNRRRVECLRVSRPSHCPSSLCCSHAAGHAEGHAISGEAMPWMSRGRG
jgi:hypothetical protein